MRGKIVLAFVQYDYGWGLDFSTPSGTTTLELNGTPVTFHTQPIYDHTGGSYDNQVSSIQEYLKDAATNTDPHNWYFTSTNRAGDLTSSRTFALGGSVSAPVGFNTVALDQIIQFSATGREDQQTLGVVPSDFPNDTSGYIDAIIARNPGLP